MKIGIDGRLWNETGVGRYIRNLVENLHEIDRNNEYVLFLRSEDHKKPTINNSQLTKDENWKIVDVDIRWHTIEEQVKFPSILSKENLDLVHFPYFSVPVNYKKPYVITIHDLILNHFPTGKASTLPFPFYQIKQYGYKYVLNNAIKNAKRIIVPLNAVRQDLNNTLKIGGDKVVVTQEGFDNKIFNKNLKDIVDVNNYFLYVGNAYPHKNLDRLIEAFKDFRNKEGEAELYLVGKDDYFYRNLARSVMQKGLSGITFRHNVSDEDLALLYRSAKAFISASLMEGFGLPAVEAMALSCPVLVSDIPSFREVCKDAAVYFDPMNTKDITKKMEETFYLDKHLRKKNIEKGLDRVKEFSWKKMAEQTQKVYESSISL